MSIPIQKSQDTRPIQQGNTRQNDGKTMQKNDNKMVMEMYTVKIPMDKELQNVT